MLPVYRLREALVWRSGLFQRPIIQIDSDKDSLGR